MNVYLDTSIILRRLRRESAPLPGWATWENAYASVLLRVETLRTLDRMRLGGALGDDQLVELMASAGAVFAAINFVPLHAEIVNRAAQPFRTALGTLDALHLSTALWVSETGTQDLKFLTHDNELAVAARSAHFEVEGV